MNVVKDIIQHPTYYLLGVLLLVIYLGYPIYLRTAVWVTNDSLWNPYIFGGMPSYAVGGVGYKWFNLIYVFADTTKIVLYCCPLGVLAFVGAMVWFYHHQTTLAYLLMLFTEIIMLYFAFWEFGILKGWL
jgi:hypothetical protein